MFSPALTVGVAVLTSARSAPAVRDVVMVSLTAVPGSVVLVTMAVFTRLPPALDVTVPLTVMSA